MFFSKKKQLPHYRVFMHRVQKFKWIANELKSVPANELTILIYFFEETLDNMKKLLDAVGIDFQSSSERI